MEKEVVAFLNSREGGNIFIGIDDSGSVSGVTDLDSEQLKIKDRLKNNVSPSILGLFDIHSDKMDNKDIIKITIASGSEKPYYLTKHGMPSKGVLFV